jgi:L-alanine-DL-glutamate epimerase-like enolase superfamily enzyme
MSSSELRIDHFDFRELRIPFKTAFRHASADRSATETVWIDAIAADGEIGFGESCPRPYVTGETLESARVFISRHEGSIRSSITGMDALRQWVAEHEAEIDANPAAWCAVELAILDLLGKHHDVPLEGLLSLTPLVAQRFRYTAVLGDASPPTFHALAERYRTAGFSDFKVKLSGDVERDRDKMSVFDRWPGEMVRVRADANNLWPHADAAIAGIRSISDRFFAIEEPIGVNRHADLQRICDELNCAIVLDESFVRRGQLALLTEPRSRWLINVRVSKMGGVLRSLEVLKTARLDGAVRIIVGAQVGETSLLTRAALAVAIAAGDWLVAQEGAFGTFLLERDVCDPPLMFGPAGVLDAASHPMLARPGLGLSPHATSRF